MKGICITAHGRCREAKDARLFTRGSLFGGASGCLRGACDGENIFLRGGANDNVAPDSTRYIGTQTRTTRGNALCIRHFGEGGLRIRRDGGRGHDLASISKQLKVIPLQRLYLAVAG